MNLLLHWLRRDLRRHAPWLLLWSVLVALFTWARIWFRTHPDFFIGDRDLWLSVPAEALGFAEICLILHVMLDDPARGPRAFWKTRPASGGSVFGAKAIMVVLVALVIPFAAELIFLTVVGPSAGTPERFSLCLLPPVLALLTGAAASTWKGTLLWLPVFMVLLAVAVAAVVWLAAVGWLRGIADHRLVATVAIAGSAAAAGLVYRRRSADAAIAGLALTAPVIAAAALAGTGWPRDSRLQNPPPGITAAEIRLNWMQPPTVSRNYSNVQPGLSLPLQVLGLPDTSYVEATLRNVVISAEDYTLKRTKMQTDERQLHSYSGKTGAFWHLKLTESEAKSLRDQSWTVSGTLELRVFGRKRHSLALDRTHTVDAGSCRWIITPALTGSNRLRHYYDDRDYSGLWYQCEFLRFSPLTSPPLASIDRDAASLHRAAGNLTLRMPDGLSADQWYLTWEGIGRGGNRLNYATMTEAERVAAQELKDPANWKNWTLELDTLTLAGTLEVPFSLRWDGTPAKP